MSATCFLEANWLLIGVQFHVARKKKPPASVRLSLRITPKVYNYLLDLTVIGLHGRTTHEVANNLISKQIEQLLADKFFERESETSKRLDEEWDE